jgi:hypothetical protein
MNLGKYIFGIREEYFHQVEEGERNEQFRSYNLLSAMFYVLVLLSFLAGVSFGLVIFQNWLIAICVGLFLCAITFILLLLVLFLNMTTNHQNLYNKMTNMKLVYDEFDQHDFSGISDEKAQAIVQDYKIQLRAASIEAEPDAFHLSSILTSSIKVTLVIILSCIIANGIEFIIFQKKINESLELIRNSPAIIEAGKDLSGNNEHVVDDKKLMAQWTIQMVTEQKEMPFKLLDSYSVVLDMQILQQCLGKWKLLFDFLFAVLFLVPFVLVRKSKRYAGGVFLKEMALSDISTSLMFYMLSKRKCINVKKYIEEEYDYGKLLKINGNAEG